MPYITKQQQRQANRRRHTHTKCFRVSNNNNILSSSFFVVACLHSLIECEWYEMLEEQYDMIQWIRSYLEHSKDTYLRLIYRERSLSRYPWKKEVLRGNKMFCGEYKQENTSDVEEYHHYHPYYTHTYNFIPCNRCIFFFFFFFLDKRNGKMVCVTKMNDIAW